MRRSFTTLKILTGFMLLSASHSAIARRFTSIDLPLVKSHSKLDLVVTKGDRVHLKIEAAELTYAFEWKSQDKIICQIYECIVNTRSLTVGRSEISVLVYNEMGSREFTFKLEIMEPSPEYKPTDVTPDVVAALPLDEIQFSEDVVENRVNGSTIFTANEKIIIGKVPRNVRFTEKIETSPDSELALVREGVYEIVFSKNTKVELQKSLSMKIVRLTQGSARIRALGNFGEFELEIMCGRKIIRTQKDSDFNCRMSSEKDGRAEVINYRGKIKVKDEISSSLQYDLKVGENLTTDNSVEVRGKVNTFETFKASTPQYLLSAKVAKNPTFITQDLLELTKLTDVDTKKKAEDLLSQEDPILALETLLPKYKSMKVDGEFNTLIGEAYIQLQFLEESATFLDRAVKLVPEDDRAHYLRAKAYFELNNCQKALTSLKKILDLKPSEELAVVLYETGYCQFEADRHSQARLYLRTSLWHTESDSLRAKIVEILRKIDEKSRFSLSGKALLGYVSNATRTAKSHENPLFTEQIGSSLYYGSFLANYRPWATDLYKVDFGWEASMKGYLSDKLDNYGTSRHQIFSSFELETDIQGAGEDRFFAKATPNIEIVSVGENRTGDSYGYLFEGGYKGKRSLSVWYESTTVIDPLPAANDYFDTFMNSAIVPSDRSMAIARFGLEATAFQTGNIKLDLGLDQKTFKMSAEASSSDSRTDQDFSILFKHASPRSENIFKVGLITSSYAYLPEREESGSYLNWTWTYLITPLLSLDNELLYETFKSTEDGFTFTNTAITTGCTLDL